MSMAMRSAISVALGVCLLATVVRAQAPAAATYSLTVRATGFRSANGDALVAVYASPDAWLHQERAIRSQKLSIRDGAIDVRFDGLPPGAYGVTVVHDENRNGRLDMRWFPWPRPKEGGGVSNNKGGRPRWRDARFELGRDLDVDITIAYY